MIDKKILITGTIVALLVFLVGALVVGGNGDTAEQEQMTGPVIADFQLLDQDGKKVSKRDILGRPALFFFGFTFCPDVCPTMLASMSASLVKLGEKSDKLGVYFVSVDPERDTSPVLKSYLSSFDPRIRGLTGTPAQIDAVAKSLGIYHARVDTGGGNYSIDHSALLIQLDSQGHFFGTIAFDEAPDAVQAKLKRLVVEGMK
ncbi:MAG: SCO family protein [Micropepsaceae bacterium]